MTCRKETNPTRNKLIEEHFIWRNMCRTYGVQDLVDLKEDYRNNFSHLVLKNIQLRLIHLRSRFDTLQSLLHAQKNSPAKDQSLINDVKNLCMQLENLIERLKQTQEEMERHGTLMETCVEKYKKSMKNFDRLCKTSSDDEQDFRMDRLNSLSSEQNLPALDNILEDIEFRERFLLASKSHNDNLDELEKKLQKISDVKQELNRLREHLQAIKDRIDEYDRMLRDEQFPDISCSKFILLLERMRIRTEEFEISNHFPRTDGLMRTWMNDHSTDEGFKPKVVKLFQVLEMDIQTLFQDFNWIYSLPYKIGVIGHGSVGKSALVMNLTDMKTLSAMIDFERSTFGYLQFDTRIYKDPDHDRIIPITFIDMEGETDVDESESAGNYLQLIKKADCDLYLIVFDNLFSKCNRICQEYIEHELERQCLLVRSKADVLFNQCFREAYGETYGKTRSKEYRKNVVFNRIKNHASKTFDNHRLETTVYLTAVICEDNLKNASFAEFDLNVLKKKLIQSAKTNFRAERICSLASRSAIRVINTCFRRGYVVSQTMYKWLSVGASIIPLLNEVPAFFGREKIRQIFGIHDNTTLTNFLNRSKNTFEYYLLQRKLTVPKEKLKSGEFQYLMPKTTTSETSTNNPTTTDQNQRTQRIQRTLENSVRPFGTGGSMVGVASASDVTSEGTSAVSKVGIAVSFIFRPLAAALSFHSTAQRMNTELHLICDDLAVIVQYFIINRCVEFCPKIQSSSLSMSADEHSSSSSDSDDDYFST